MIRSRKLLALFGAVVALACGAAWFASRSASVPSLAVDPVAPDVLARIEPPDIELAAVPDAPGARAAEVPREAARSTAKYDRPAARPRATYVLAGRVVDDRGVACDSFVIRADPAGEDVEGRQYATDKFRDSAGAFRLAGVTDGEWSVRATDDLGLVSVPQTVVMPRDARRALDFVLPRPAAISGRVVDGDGKPAASALVEAKQLVDDVEVALRSVTSEADGTFRLAGVPAVGVVLTARRKDRSSSLPAKLALQPGAELVDVLLVLRGGGAIEGNLVDGDQRPRFEVEVSVVRTDDPTRRQAIRTDRSGRFRFDDLEPGMYSVTTSPVGGAAGLLTRSVLVESDRVTFVDLGSGPPARILVRGVVRADRKGVRAEVSFHPVGAASRTPGTSGDRTCRASTNPAGEYELRLAAAGTYVVEASTFGLARVTRSVEITDAPTQVVDLAFGTGGIRGRVMGPDGLPLDWVTVTAMQPAAFVVLGSGDDSATTAVVETATDGSYTVRGLLAGTYTLTAVANEARSTTEIGLAPAVVEGFVLGDGEQRDGVDLRIEPGGSVRVLVLDAKGKPAARARATAGTLLVIGIAADAKGIATLEGLPPGEILVAATSEDECSAQPIRVVVIPGRVVDATIRLVPAGKFSVQIVRRDGSPFADPPTAAVTVRDARGETRGATYSMELGTPAYRQIGYGPLPPGTYTVQARFGARTAEQRIDVTVGSEATVVLTEPDG